MQSGFVLRFTEWTFWRVRLLPLKLPFIRCPYLMDYLYILGFFVKFWVFEDMFRSDQLMSFIVCSVMFHRFWSHFSDSCPILYLLILLLISFVMRSNFVFRECFCRGKWGMKRRCFILVGLVRADLACSSVVTLSFAANERLWNGILLSWCAFTWWSDTYFWVRL